MYSGNWGKWETKPESQSLFLNIQSRGWWDSQSTNYYHKQRGAHLRHGSSDNDRVKEISTNQFKSFLFSDDGLRQSPGYLHDTCKDGTVSKTLISDFSTFLWFSNRPGLQIRGTLAYSVFNNYVSLFQC